jgi:hypothetical protein
MRRLHIVAGLTFVSAWIVGLVLAASGPTPDDPAAKIAAYFAAYEYRSMVAHFLIDGVAGAAIIAIAFSLRRYLMVTGGGNLQPVMFRAGIGAGLASFAQAITGETLSYRAANGASADSIQTLFKVLNNGDTMKIAFLAIMIGAASILARRGGAFPRWLATSGIVFAPILALRGLAFPLNNDALYASLELTLLLLLTWVISVAVVVARRAPRAEAVSMATALS